LTSEPGGWAGSARPPIRAGHLLVWPHGSTEVPDLPFGLFQFLEIHVPRSGGATGGSEATHQPDDQGGGHQQGHHRTDAHASTSTPSAVTRCEISGSGVATSPTWIAAASASKASSAPATSR